jgi:hypothetical protein
MHPPAPTNERILDQICHEGVRLELAVSDIDPVSRASCLGQDGNSALVHP